MVWPPGEPVRARRLPAWSVAGVVGLVGVAVGASMASGPPWLDLGRRPRGNRPLLHDADRRQRQGTRWPGGPRVSLRPVQWLGLISYSLYLWHWPAIVLMTAATTGLTGWQLLVARSAAMLAASCASFYLVERPLRRADWGALARRLRVPAASMATAGVLATTAVIVAGTVGPPEVAQATVSSTAIHNAAGTPLHRSRWTSPWPPGRIRSASGSSGTASWSTARWASPWLCKSTGAISVVTNTAFPGWGLTRDPAWPADVLPTVAASHPQIMIGTWYWDDKVAHADPAAYRARLERAAGSCSRPGRRGGR